MAGDVLARMADEEGPPLRLAPACADAETSLLSLGHLNLAEFVRHMARSGGSILEEDGLLLAAGAHAHPGPYRNAAIRLRPVVPGEEVRRRAAEFFAPRRHGYVIWAQHGVDDDLIHACNRASMPLVEEGGLPELFLPDAPDPLPVPPAIQIADVVTEQQRWDFLAVNAESWGMGNVPVEQAAKVLFHPDTLVAPNVAAVLAYADDVPVSGALTLVSHGVAGGYWGATSWTAVRRWLKDKRRLATEESSRRERVSLADLCSRIAITKGLALGARCAVSQASPSRQPLWRRMGCRSIGLYSRFLGRPVPARWE
jgi:hypothetical protein